MNNKEFQTTISDKWQMTIGETRKLIGHIVKVMGDLFEEGNPLAVKGLGIFAITKHREKIIVDSKQRRMLIPPKLELNLFKPEQLPQVNPLTMDDLASALAKNISVDKEKASEWVESFFSLLVNALNAELMVKVKGLGAFKALSTQETKFIDTDTGGTVSETVFDKVSFSPDTSMRDLVNRPFSQFIPVELNEGLEFDDMQQEYEPELLLGTTLVSEELAAATPEEPAVEAALEEPAAEATPEEPTAEAAPEEPTAEAAHEEPTAEAAHEEPTAEAALEEPAAEAAPEEPAAEAAPEEPTAEASPEEPAAEASTEEPAAEATPEETPSPASIPSPARIPSSPSLLRRFWWIIPIAAIAVLALLLLWPNKKQPVGNVVETVPAPVDTIAPKPALDLEALNSQYPYGAYEIIGIDTTVVVKKGETLEWISTVQIGSGLEPYIKILNGGIEEIHEGDSLMIPALQLKKQFRN